MSTPLETDFTSGCESIQEKITQLKSRYASLLQQDKPFDELRAIKDELKKYEYLLKNVPQDGSIANISNKSK